MPISINLDSDLIVKLDEAAAKEQVSRSRFIAKCVETYLVEGALRSTKNNELKEIQKQFRESETTIGSIKKELKDAKSENEVLKSEIAELEADLKECQTTEAVVTGLQRELDYTQREKGRVEVDLQTLKEHVRKLEDDKDYLKEQLSRVTLLLPAPLPKFSFREWLFGKGKKKDKEGNQPQ
jgi:metal-responsive CopG/Arc/MetJ family transcriptional regulator